MTLLRTPVRQNFEPIIINESKMMILKKESQDTVPQIAAASHAGMWRERFESLPHYGVFRLVSLLFTSGKSRKGVCAFKPPQQRKCTSALSSGCPRIDLKNNECSENHVAVQLHVNKGLMNGENCLRMRKTYCLPHPLAPPGQSLAPSCSYDDV